MVGETQSHRDVQSDTCSRHSQRWKVRSSVSGRHPCLDEPQPQSRRRCGTAAPLPDSATARAPNGAIRPCPLCPCADSLDIRSAHSRVRPDGHENPFAFHPQPRTTLSHALCDGYTSQIKFDLHAHAIGVNLVERIEVRVSRAALSWQRFGSRGADGPTGWASAHTLSQVRWCVYINHHGALRTSRSTPPTPDARGSSGGRPGRR